MDNSCSFSAHSLIMLISAYIEKCPVFSLSYEEHPKFWIGLVKQGSTLSWLDGESTVSCDVKTIICPQNVVQMFVYFQLNMLK